MAHGVDMFASSALWHHSLISPLLILILALALLLLIAGIVQLGTCAL